MSTTKAPPRTLDLAKVSEHIESLAPVVGGWAAPVQREHQHASHYFRIHTDPDGLQYMTGAALCGYQDLRNELDLDEVDPMALENCKECRRLLLTLRRLI